VNPSRSYIAAALLTLGGLLAALTALAIVFARMAVEAGFAVKPADRLLLEDLTAILPLILGFVVVDLAIAVGLVGRRTWAVASASFLALGVVALGGYVLAVILLGTDTLPGGGPRAAEADGLGIVGAFTAIYLFALITLRSEGLPSGRASRSIQGPHREEAF
jgi:hypothetical protein